MSESISSAASGRSAWPRELIVFMLAFISTNGKLFESADTRPNGFATLARRLETIRPKNQKYNSKKVENKLREIWKWSHGKAAIEELYLYGVHKATLPDLERWGYATYEEIRHQIDALRL